MIDIESPPWARNAMTNSTEAVLKNVAALAGNLFISPHA